MRLAGWQSGLKGATACSERRAASVVSWRCWCWAGVVALCCGCTTRALGSPLVASGGGSSPSTVITLPDQIELGSLVLLTADALKVTVEFDPALLRPTGAQGPTIHFRGDRELTTGELWEFTTQVLSNRGFAMVRPPGSKVFSVVRADAAAGLAGVRLEGDAQGHDGTVNAANLTGFVSELVRLKHRSAKDITDLTGKIGLKPPSAVTPIGDSGLLLVSEYSTRLDDLRRLIERFDVAREQVRIAVVPVRNLPAGTLAASVTALAGKRDSIEGTKLRGDVVVAPDGKSLFVVAPDESHKQWAELITLLDQLEPVVTVEYATRAFTPREVADLIDKTVRETPSSASPAAAAAASATTNDRLRTAINDLTGTLIVTGTPSQQERIRKLLDQLESAPTAAARPLRAFSIRNRPAEEVMSTLTALVHGGALHAADIARQADRSSDQRTAGTDAGAQWSPSAGSVMPVVVPAPGASSASAEAPNASRPDRGRDDGLAQAGRGRNTGLAASGISMNLDKGTNSVIVMAEPRMLAQIEALIRLIDVRQPQVMLEMTLVSLSDQDAMNLGIELEKVGSFDGASYQVSSLFGLAGGTAGNRTAGDSRGLTTAVLNPGDFSIVLRALQTLSTGSTRSMPSVLVSNNESASFNSVLQQPYTVSNTTSGAGTTTSFGGTQDAGTTISVTPQIAEADQLLLQYSIALSSFVGAPPTNGLPPARQQNTVTSKATIPDGFTVVVGGIELQSEGKNTSQIPGIGDVPLLGELFKTRDNSAGRSRFYVFIRATVLREQQLNDLKHLSGHAGRAAGVSDGFPAMRPRIIK